MVSKKIIGYIITAIILVLFGYYFATNLDQFKALFSVSPLLIIVVAVLYTISFGLRAWFYQVMMEPFGIKLPFFEGFFSSFMTSFGNYFLPLQSGSGIRAVYLNRKYNFPYSEFISTLSGTFVITFFSVSFIGALSLAGLYFINGKFSWILFLFFLGVLVFTVFLAYAKFSKLVIKLLDKTNIKFLHVILGKFNEIIIGWEKITQKKSLFLKLAGISMLDHFLYTFLTYLIFRSLGFEIGVLELFIYVSIGAFSVLVNITPAAIGIKEAMVIAFASVISINNAEIFQVGILDRVIMFILLFIFFVFFQIFGRKEFEMARAESTQKK